jgi:hypothetical protein
VFSYFPYYIQSTVFCYFPYYIQSTVFPLFPILYSLNIILEIREHGA